MKETGHFTLWDTECIFIVNDCDIVVIPKNKDDIERINSHFEERDFIIKYSSSIGCSTAFVDRVEHESNGAIKLIPKYIVNRCHEDSFGGFEITGESIDDFFRPSRYFYDQKKEGTKAKVDYLYNSEVADAWTVVFENNPITITLSYGDILRWGSSSDLKLHPKLTVDFNKTTDTQYVYRVYRLIVRFLQIVRYETKCGKFNVELFHKEQGGISYNGYLLDLVMDGFALNQNLFYGTAHDIEYGSYKPYMQRLLQFSADNPQYAFYHFPADGMRYRGRHYSSGDFLSIFSAFESECHANRDLYEKADTTRIQGIKNSLIDSIDKCQNADLSEDELDFLKTTKANLLKQGTEFGLRKKIKNAYEILQKALESSIENIFFLPEFKCKGNLSDINLNRIVEFLVGQRSAIAHGSFPIAFSDLDAQKIHFLEILVYAQLLKRAGLNDMDIERVIGVVFVCNYVLFQEKYH